MKLARSALLQELLSAHALVYGDCERFQTICPDCGEAVFKVVRAIDDVETHYFSHHKKDLAFNQECELRVGSISSNQVRDENAKARGQTIAYFCSVLQAEVMDQLGYTAAEDKCLRRSWGCRFVVQDIADRWTRSISEKSIHDALEKFFNGLIPETAFEASMQIGIVKDVLKHLTSHTGRQSLEFMCRYAINKEIVGERGFGEVADMGKNLAAIVGSGKREAARNLVRLKWEIDLKTFEGPAVAVIACRIVEALARLNYLKMLRDFRASKRGVAA